MKDTIAYIQKEANALSVKMEPKDYEKDILDIDKVEGTDIKINPEYYIHNAIIKAQNALATEEIETGYLKFRMLVENIETLSRAASLIDTTYDDQVKKFEEGKEIKELKNKDPIIASARIANFKLGLLMKEVFENKAIISKLRA